MLEAEHRRRGEHRDLLAIAQRLERRAHHDFGLAVADIAAQQAVHGLRTFHVAFDIGDRCFLVARFGELEGVFEFALPVAVGGKRKALREFALRVELQQLFRHIAHFRFDARLGARPGGAAHAVELRLRFALAAKSLHQIHARQRHIELVAARIFEQHVVAFGIALGNLANAEELADAVLGVDHVIARLQIELVRGKRSRAQANRFRRRLRRIEEIFSAEDHQPSFRKYRAVRNIAANQRNSRARRLRAFAQVFRHHTAAEIDLIGNAVLGKHIGDALQFTRRWREERDMRTSFDQRLRFFDGELQITVKGQ